VKTISPRDFTRLQRAILALHSHRELAGFRRAVPGIFMDMIPADYFSVADARMDFEKKTYTLLDLWESRPVRAGRILEAFERNIYDHPFVLHVLEHGPCGALILSDFLTLPQLRRTRLYRDVFGPTNFGRVISVGSISGPGAATITLARPETARDFTERDRAVIELLEPHFALARTNIEHESRARAGRARSLKGLGLTPREIEVALWLSQGKTNPEIATILGAPARTIEKHVERVLHKLGVEHRAAAAVAVAEIIRA
jgi:DNA-binding CsgD family transcriptional regulator